MLSLQGSATICEGGNTILNATFLSGQTYRWKSNGQNFSNTSNTITVSQSGIYTLEARNNVGCTKESNPVEIAVTTRPVASIFASGPTSVCAGTSISLVGIAGSGTIFKWLRNDTIISGNGTPLLSVNQSGFYRFISQIASTCADTSSSISVTINPLPQIIVSTNLTSFCQGDSIKIKAIKTPGSNVKWIRNSDTLSITIDSIWIKQSGTYRAVVRNGGGCKSVSLPQNIIVNGLPPGSILLINNTLVAQPPLSIYQWLKGADSLLNATSQIFVPTESG